MGDDRVLLIPSEALPDPALMERYAAPRALLRRLRAFLPVDFAVFPTLRGNQEAAASWTSWEDVNGFTRAAVEPQHHTVDLTGVIFNLEAVGGARSHTLVGFGINPGTLAARGYPLLATASEAIGKLLMNPSQLITVLLQGAEEETIQVAIREAEAAVDRGVIDRLAQLVPTDQDLSSVRLDIPTLYLELPLPFPGPEARLEILQSMVGDLTQDVLAEWPLHLHEEQGGHELADKLIPFITKVIAEREAGE
ncbi:MAG: hypothetical protein WEB00_09270 [Dehalococcoidia bacterium]